MKLDVPRPDERGRAQNPRGPDTRGQLVAAETFFWRSGLWKIQDEDFFFNLTQEGFDFYNNAPLFKKKNNGKCFSTLAEDNPMKNKGELVEMCCRYTEVGRTTVFKILK